MTDECATPTRERGKFDTFSEVAAHFYSKSYAFIIAIVMLVVWAACGPLMKFSDTWHLMINTPTTIVTFLGVFLIQNQAWRDGQAVNKKLNAIADAMADFLEGTDGMEQHAQELKNAVGLEKREGS